MASIKEFLKRFLPNHHDIKKEKRLRFLGKLLHEPNLFHLNRRSVAGGVAAGLFAAFIPLPFQMIIAVLISLVLRVNIPVAIVCTWITNPFTFVPFTYLIYKIGNLVVTGNSAKIFLVGTVITCILSATLGYIIVRLVWRIAITIRQLKRKSRVSS